MGLGLRRKTLLGVPWRVAHALARREWIVRAAVTWCRRHCLPDPARDQPARTTETVFLLAKQRHYRYRTAEWPTDPADDVWVIDAEQSTGPAAAFPIDLPKRCLTLSAGGPGRTVLDPFAGTGTTLVAATRIGADAIGIDITPETAACTRKRVSEEHQPALFTCRGREREQAPAGRTTQPSPRPARTVCAAIPGTTTMQGTTNGTTASRAPTNRPRHAGTIRPPQQDQRYRTRPGKPSEPRPCTRASTAEDRQLRAVNRSKRSRACGAPRARRPTRHVRGHRRNHAQSTPPESAHGRQPPADGNRRRKPGTNSRAPGHRRRGLRTGRRRVRTSRAHRPATMPADTGGDRRHPDRWRASTARHPRHCRRRGGPNRVVGRDAVAPQGEGVPSRL